MSFFVFYFHKNEGEADDGENEEKIKVSYPVSDVQGRKRVKSDPYAMLPRALFTKEEIPFDVHENDEKNADCIAEYVS